nr:thioredoxin domain-containing protein [Aquimarina agarilytica]
METHEFTNDLIHETSPYLLQHAHNPVNWKAWHPETLKEAKEKKKLMLISVGYAACHWCHVMEHESFEDSTVAAVMNKNYINIKIDREERPDIDQVYMSAVQLMTGRGGWPLNVIALPDGRPVWGGTYYPKAEWMGALQQIQKIYEDDPSKLEEYATKLTEGIQSVSLVTPNPNALKFENSTIESAVETWAKKFDYKKGGLDYAPKFMMPNNYHFLLRYAHQTNNEKLKDYVITTLNQISYGGVYDHVGGGFARYATDEKWHVPHFEKMLYDNAQLVSLYSDAYLLTKNEWYKQVVYETLDFVQRELTNAEGVFYSSLDADSVTHSGKLEEGAFYVWQKPALETALGVEDFKLFADYYNVNAYGIWEHNNYVLIRNESDADFIEKHKLDKGDFLQKQKKWKQRLLSIRSKRERPRLDDKTLTSWNALMLKGYADAYSVFNDANFLKVALTNAAFIKNKQMASNGQLMHNYKEGKSTINGYLEDYAATIDAFIALYQVTFDQQWLDLSKTMTDYVFDHFYDDASGLFFFTSDEDAALVTRNIESSDNVIPASNSMMAKNLYKLSHYFSNKKYLEHSQKMLHNIQVNIEEYPSGYSNWLDLMLNYTEDFYEVVIVGAAAEEKRVAIQKQYYPNKIIAGSAKESNQPLLQNRFSEKDTHIFICVNNACKYPVTEVEAAFKLLNDK